MTEQQLRQKVADKMTSWVGATKGSAKHAEILKIYNDHRPLARGYKMKVNDAYCAATVSAAWIACGLAPYTGTECGVEKFARLAQDKGIWVENDAHVPKLGDAVVYDWQDNGVGDCTGAGDHIGIVTKAGATSFTVTEGNMTGGKVGTRPMSVNGRYIRGFITPNYADIARALGGASIPTDTAPDTSGKSIEEIAKILDIKRERRRSSPGSGAPGRTAGTACRPPGTHTPPSRPRSTKSWAAAPERPRRSRRPPPRPRPRKLLRRRNSTAVSPARTSSHRTSAPTSAAGPAPPTGSSRPCQRAQRSAITAIIPSGAASNGITSALGKPWASFRPRV